MKLKAISATLAACSLLLVSCQQPFEPTTQKEIQASETTVTIPSAGGAATITLTAMDSWHLDESTLDRTIMVITPGENGAEPDTTYVPWLTVTPTSGGAGETKVTISAEIAELDRVNTIEFVCGNMFQQVMVQQAGDPSLKPQFPEVEEGDYWIMVNTGTSNEPDWQVAKPVGSAYGYLYCDSAIVGEDGSVSSTAANVFTLKAVEGGFTIQDAAGQYYYMTGTYDSFNVTTDASQSGNVWRIEQTADQQHTIVNAGNGKTMQYSVGYSSFGAYSAVSSDNLMPYLVKAEAPAPDLITVDQTEWTVKKAAGTLDIPAEGTTFVVGVDYEADWLQYVGVKYVDGVSCLEFDYTENPGPDTRTVTVSVLASDGSNETSVELEISQLGVALPSGLEGDGSLENPYTVADGNVIFNAGAWENYSDALGSAYFTGTVCGIEEISPDYGNGTYYISADGEESGEQLYIFRGKYYDGENFTSEDQLKVGDVVVLSGYMDEYKGTYEITDSSIYSINGETAVAE